MNKKIAYTLFIILASGANLLIAAALFFGSLALYSLALAPVLKLKSASPVLLGAFAIAIVGSSLAWKRILDALVKRPGFAARFGLTRGTEKGEGGSPL